MNIIPKDEYFDFLNKKNKTCAINSYKKLYNLKNKVDYPKSNSNIQIKYLITNIYKNKNIKCSMQFMLLLTQFISFNDSHDLLNIIKSKNLKDNEIMKYVERYKNPNSTELLNKECSKQQFGLELLKNVIKKNIKNNILKNIFNKDSKYLDIGCGKGNKTMLFGKIFKLNNIYGTDIENWGPYYKNRKFAFNFKFILKDGTLDYEDNTFDIITCFLTLHHIKDINLIISEIYRILKPNGIFILIEHDILNYYDNMIVDIQHLFFAFLYDKNKKYIENPFYSNYFNCMEFEYIFTEKNRFKLIYTDNFYQTIDMTKRYDQQFYQIYLKN